MFLTETTVDAETAQPVDGTKMLVDDGCDLCVNDAVAVVEAANCLVGGHWHMSSQADSVGIGWHFTEVGNSRNH